MALEEEKPLGCEANSKVQPFGGLLDEAVQSVHVCGKDITVSQNLTCLYNQVHHSGGA